MRAARATVEGVSLKHSQVLTGKVLARHSPHLCERPVREATGHHVLCVRTDTVLTLVRGRYEKHPIVTCCATELTQSSRLCENRQTSCERPVQKASGRHVLCDRTDTVLTQGETDEETVLTLTCERPVQEVSGRRVLCDRRDTVLTRGETDQETLPRSSRAI